MKQVFKRILNFIMFFGIGVSLLSVVTGIFTPKWTYSEKDYGEGSRYRSFYKLKENTLDYVVIGVSHSFFAVNPMQIYADTGYTGYDLGSPFQPQSVSYYWLKEAVKTQDIKCVFVDVSSIIKDVQNNEQILKNLILMKPSVNKLEAIRECSPKEETLYAALFPLYRFHERWEELDTEDYSGADDSEYYTKGATERFTIDNSSINNDLRAGELDCIVQNDSGDTEINTEYRDVSEEELEYFGKIIDFCDENGIVCIPIKCPTTRWNPVWSEKVSEYLAERDMTLLDLTDPEKVRIDWTKDTHDEGGHVNYFGSVKSSQYIAEYLKGLGILTDHRNQASYEGWDQDLAKYRDWEYGKIASRLNPKENMYRYFDMISQNKDKYLVLYSSMHDPRTVSDNCLDDLIGQSGFEDITEVEPQESMLAVIDGGNKSFLYSEYRKSSYTGNYTAQDGSVHSVEMISSSYSSGDESTIVFDGEDYSYNDKDGLNILVVDRKDGTVLSKAFVGTDSDGSLLFRQNTLSSEADGRLAEYQQGLSIEGQVILSSVSGDFVQELSTRSSNGGTLLLMNPEESAAMEATSGGNNDGDSVGFGIINDTAMQKWIPLKMDDGTWRVLSLYSGLFLSEENGELVQREYKDSSEQKFFVK